MLPRFRVNLEDCHHRAGRCPERGRGRHFEKVGVPPADAVLGADVLTVADLRGVDSHGVSNMLRSYLGGYQRGEINPRPAIRIVRETASTASLDSDRGLGIIVTPKAMEIAIEKARQSGVGMVTVGNSRHLGMASYHAMLALEHDMIGVCMTSAPPRMVPTFGAEPRLGTNPIAVAVPARQEPPFVFDAATSSVAQNKIEIARRAGRRPGTRLAGYRGRDAHYGGGAGAAQLPSAAYGSDPGVGFPQGLWLGLRSGYFGRGTDRFRLWGRSRPAQLRPIMWRLTTLPALTIRSISRMKWTAGLRMMKATKPAPGHDRVLVAGQPEAEMEAVRRHEGIPLHPEVIDWLRDTCGELGVAWGF